MFFSAKAAFMDSLRDDEPTDDNTWITSDEPTTNSSDRTGSSAYKSSSPCDFDDQDDLFSRHLFERRKEAVSTFLINYHNDLYQILGVSFSATKAEIRNAFKKLSLEHHPDKALLQTQN